MPIAIRPQQGVDFWFKDIKFISPQASSFSVLCTLDYVELNSLTL